MINTLKKMILPIAILFVIGFVLFLVNQVSGIYLMIHTSSALAANIFLIGVSLIISILLLWPLFLYARLPGPLRLPADEKELSNYRLKLIKRLQKNKTLIKEEKTPNDEETLGQALEILDNYASRVIRETAATTFLTTSISQNGKLDALTVLAAQSRMVWKIAHIYYQRPTLRELAHLYAHVAGSSFLASQVEELDISRQIEPVVSSMLKNSAGKSIPLLGQTTQLILDSLLEGSTNAFLTLRVGNIAKKYCGWNDVMDSRKLRMQAFNDSARQLRSITVSSSGKIISAIARATKKAGLDSIRSGWDSIRTTGNKVTDTVVETGKKYNPFRKKTEV